jgi:3-oxoacyl-[acyl-carrier protein] reductase
MPGKLAGKVAIITGAGGGYGEGIAKKFTEEGAKVVLIDIVADNIARVTAELPSGAAVGIQGDVSKEPSWQAAFDEAIKNFGKVDIVVNNAGVVNGARVCGIWN